MGNPASVRDLCALSKEASSRLVFLCETRQSVEKMSRLRGRLGLRGFTGVSSEGMSGGLALYWDESVSVDVKDINKRYIDAYVQLSPEEPQWHVTFVYGEPRVENRHRMWSLLRTIHQSSSLPWAVIGDFNETMWQFEHFSRTPRGEPQMQDFRDVLQDCELHDLGFKGVPHTYDNKREGWRNVKVRLDRVVADDKWRDIYSTAQVVHLVSPCSDHCPILLNLVVKDPHQLRQKCLHYEIVWEREPEATQVIEEAWVVAGEKADLGDINKALAKVMTALRSWSRAKVKNVGRELEKARKKLAELIESNADRTVIRNATDHMNELLYREEMLWLQRSRVNWLKDEDRNTKFFHSRAVWRAKKNKISKLRDANETVHSSTMKLESMATEYFQDVYTADPNLNPETVTRLIQEKVTDIMNEKLCEDFTEDEISQAIFQIGPLKSPGPDGFPARFYQRNWGTIKADIIGAVRRFFQTGLMPEGVNDTAIVLIPKKEQPVDLRDFRPISLCNVVYKVVSKCLVNRLRPILDDLVSVEQSAFV